MQLLLRAIATSSFKTTRYLVPRYLSSVSMSPGQRAEKRQRGDGASAKATSSNTQFANLFQAFESIGKEMREFDEKREVVIKKSRDVQKNSKQAIFSVHRGDIDQANSRLKSAEAGYAELEPLINETPGLRSGSFSHAMEEYAEARIFLHFHETKTLLVPSDLPQVRLKGSLAHPRATSHSCSLQCRLIPRNISEGSWTLLASSIGGLSSRQPAEEWTTSGMHETVWMPCLAS